MIIKNPDPFRPVILDCDLSKLHGIGWKLNFITFVKHLRLPTAYLIHCDLIDKNKNLFNGKRSDILVKYDIKGKPYEKVGYHASPQQPFRDCSTDSQVNSVTLSVRGQSGELFDFNDMPIEFELEINSIQFLRCLLWTFCHLRLLYTTHNCRMTDFTMQKVNEISASLNKEVAHYRAVAKKYKHTKKVVNWSAADSRALSAAFSSLSFSSALSVVGLPATSHLAASVGLSLSLLQGW